MTSAIAPDAADRYGALVGIDVAAPDHEIHTTASYDAIRAYARSIGDDNPLFVDDDYGTSTRWGSQIGPGIMCRNVNAPMLGDPVPAEIKQATGGVFRGVHQYYSSGEWEWFRPIYPGDQLLTFAAVESVVEKASDFAGRSILVTRREVRLTSTGDVVAVRRQLMVYADRSSSRARGKNAAVEVASYEPGGLDALDAIYAAERRRGADPRCVEDVAPGDEAGPMAKGPLTVTEVVALHAAGYGGYPYLTASRLAYQLRTRVPSLFTANPQGVPEIVQRVHWDPESARAVGNPTTYDYGIMREFWLHHLLTDWVGDDGIVVSQRTQTRKFNFVGDYHVLSGKVTETRTLPAGGEVDLEVQGVNQRGEATILGSATVRLPSASTGLPAFPPVPDDIQRRAGSMLDRHHELTAERGVRR